MENLIDKIKWDTYGAGRVPVFVPLFQAKIEFTLFSDLKQPNTVSDKMLRAVNDVLNIPSSSLDIVKDLLWEECNFSFTVTDYGCLPKPGESNLEAHLREFNLSNKDDAYRRCTVSGVHISHDSDTYKNRYAEIKIDTVTDNLISLIVKNGVIIDYDDDGTYLGWFEDDERHAHQARERILGSSGR